MKNSSMKSGKFRATLFLGLLLLVIGAPYYFSSNEVPVPIVRRTITAGPDGASQITLTFEQGGPLGAILYEEILPPGADVLDSGFKAAGISDGDAFFQVAPPSVTWIIISPRPGQSVQYTARNLVSSPEGNWRAGSGAAGVIQ